jgi:surface antigen Omp85-like protein
MTTALKVLACAAALATYAPSPAAEADEAPAAASRFADPADGHFDVSGFLDTAYGFLPLLVPITEPAVGYGAVGALVFIHGEPPEAGEPYVRPTISTIGALRTENDTRGWFAANLGTWRGGRLRTIAALADVDVNLEFFGFGGDRIAGEGLGYSIKGRGGVGGASYRLGDTQLWLGMRYASVDTDVALQAPPASLPEILEADLGLQLAALTPALTLDGRDNFFTPTRGWYVDLSLPTFRESLGSDRDFETLNLTAMYYRPLGEALYFGVRASGKGSSDGTPFYLRPYVALRGVQALRYQGEQVAELEAELRWQLRPRYSVVGFAGAGTLRASIAERDRDETVTSGGAGFRYLIARRYGLHLGIDIAFGPDDDAFYVVVGNAWLRP